MNLIFNKWLLILALSSAVLACSHGNCRSQKTEAEIDAKNAKVTAAAGDTMTKPSAADRVKVFKSDGSLQCGQGKGMALAEMQTQLGSIKVYSSANRNDGMMRIQVCGSPTGNVNVYEIDRKDLATAQKKGFKEWTMD